MCLLYAQIRQVRICIEAINSYRSSGVDLKHHGISVARRTAQRLRNRTYKRRTIMERIQKSIEVERPIRSVYNQWTQFEEFPRFMEGVKQVKQLDDIVNFQSINPDRTRVTLELA